MSYNQARRAVVENEQILSDAKACLQEGCTPLLLTKEKVRRRIELVAKRQFAGVAVTVITLSAEGYPQGRIEATKELQEILHAAGIRVTTQADLHTHFAVIDEEIVWYGSMNLLSRSKEDDGLMRVKSREAAWELLTM